MSLGVWIGLGIGVWVLVGLGVALLVGRIVRQRDRQIPDDEPGATDPGPVEQTSRSGRGVPRQGSPPDGCT